MIGGKDIVIPAAATPASLDACVRIVQRQWPNARFEDAETGEKYSTYQELPVGRIRELLVYNSAEAESAWDDDRDDAPLNSMLYFILGEQSVTVVVDDPDSGDMPLILEGIRSLMGMDILHIPVTRRAA